jgi:ferredoxin
MAYKIIDECISCGACIAECVNEAIVEADPHPNVIAEKCTECVGNFESPRCVEICPVEACKADESHKESRDQLLAKWKKLHPGQTPKMT